MAHADGSIKSATPKPKEESTTTAVWLWAKVMPIRNNAEAVRLMLPTIRLPIFKAIAHYQPVAQEPADQISGCAAFGPAATDAQRLRMGKLIVAGCGLLSIAIGLVLAHARGGALSMWFSISAIASGGLAGLFLLAFLGTRATRQGVYCGISAGLLFTAWATLTQAGNPIVDLGRFNYPWHGLLIGALANIVLFTVGYGASLFFPREQTASGQITLWKWFEVRSSEQQKAVAVPRCSQLETRGSIRYRS